MGVIDRVRSFIQTRSESPSAAAPAPATPAASTPVAAPAPVPARAAPPSTGAWRHVGPMPVTVASSRLGADRSGRFTKALATKQPPLVLRSLDHGVADDAGGVVSDIATVAPVDRSAAVESTTLPALPARPRRQPAPVAAVDRQPDPAPAPPIERSVDTDDGTPERESEPVSRDQTGATAEPIATEPASVPVATVHRSPSTPTPSVAPLVSDPSRRISDASPPPSTAEPGSASHPVALRWDRDDAPVEPLPREELGAPAPSPPVEGPEVSRSPDARLPVPAEPSDDEPQVDGQWDTAGDAAVDRSEADLLRTQDTETAPAVSEAAPVSSPPSHTPTPTTRTTPPPVARSPQPTADPVPVTPVTPPAPGPGVVDRTVEPPAPGEPGPVAPDSEPDVATPTDEPVTLDRTPDDAAPTPLDPAPDDAAPTPPDPAPDDAAPTPDPVPSDVIDRSTATTPIETVAAPPTDPAQPPVELGPAQVAPPSKVSAPPQPFSPPAAPAVQREASRAPSAPPASPPRRTPIAPAIRSEPIDPGRVDAPVPVAAISPPTNLRRSPLGRPLPPADGPHTVHPSSQPPSPTPHPVPPVQVSPAAPPTIDRSTVVPLAPPTTTTAPPPRRGGIEGFLDMVQTAPADASPGPVHRSPVGESADGAWPEIQRSAAPAAFPEVDRAPLAAAMPPIHVVNESIQVQRAEAPAGEEASVEIGEAGGGAMDTAAIADEVYERVQRRLRSDMRVELERKGLMSHG